MGCAFRADATIAEVTPAAGDFAGAVGCEVAVFAGAAKFVFVAGPAAALLSGAWFDATGATGLAAGTDGDEGCEAAGRTASGCLAFDEVEAGVEFRLAETAAAPATLFTT